MIGILVITHGTVGEALIQCVCHVLNRRPPQLMHFGLSGQDDPLDALPFARRLVDLVDGGDGVMILTDILGGSPSNLAAKLLETGRVVGVAGVNVPMLLRVITYRERSMDVLLKKAIAGACEGVVQMK